MEAYRVPPRAVFKVTTVVDGDNSFGGNVCEEIARAASEHADEGWEMVSHAVDSSRAPYTYKHYLTFRRVQ